MAPLLLLGLVQGLAEFLPVSSTGHLIVLKYVFGVAAPGAVLEVALHGGTLAAVLLYYRHWLKEWVEALIRGDAGAWRYLGQLLLASLPAGIIGLWLGHALENYYFTVSATVLGWLMTAGVLWIMPPPNEGLRSVQDIGWVRIGLVGCAQALALWPGISRSGSTIVMARVVGINPQEAAQFSFLMAIPAILGALLFEAPSLYATSIPLWHLAIAVLVAAATGMVAIQWVTRIVHRPHAWRGFSLYLAVVAVIVWTFGG